MNRYNDTNRSNRTLLNSLPSFFASFRFIHRRMIVVSEGERFCCNTDKKVEAIAEHIAFGVSALAPALRLTSRTARRYEGTPECTGVACTMLKPPPHSFFVSLACMSANFSKDARMQGESNAQQFVVISNTIAPMSAQP